jgi:predicted Zn-ribbon and HTH transcriptional regulator
MQTVELESVSCIRCGHTWIPRVEEPKRCPNCSLRDWDGESRDRRKGNGKQVVEKSEKKCLRCGYEWKAIKDEPKQCPGCKRYDWNVERKSNKETDC